MPVPTLITELSTTAVSNYPSGSDSPATLDDVQRAHGAFIAQIRDAVPVSSGSNLTFTGTGNRITADFSNATAANRVMFKTSTLNSGTIVSAIPNGSALSAHFRSYGNSDPTNASFLGIRTSGVTEARVESGIEGSGTYLPMTFYTGGSERMRIDTSGNVTVATQTAGDNSTKVATTAYVATAVAAGGLLPASSAEAQALTIDTKAITPLKLADALKGANQSLAANGYQKLPGGLIIQWGIATLNSGTVVTFPLAFPTGCTSVTATTGGLYVAGVGTFTATTFTGNCYRALTETTQAQSCAWIAVGF